MALDYIQYEKDLRSIRTKMKTMTDEKSADDFFIRENINAIKKLLSTATVTVTVLPSEILVSGSPSTQVNTNSITLKGNDEIHAGGLS